MNRNILWAVFVVGVALVVAPLALSLPSKGAAGQRMLNGFQPIMQADQVQATADYYHNVFVPLGKAMPLMSAAMQSSPQMRNNFGGLRGTFSRVPAGLAHYKPLVSTMQANVDNYNQVNSLPDFRLFTWFFVVPGILLVLLAGFGLIEGRVATKHALRLHGASR